MINHPGKTKMTIREIDAVIGLRVNAMMENGIKPPYKINVNEQEWRQLNDGVFFQTDLNSNIKWNGHVIVIKPGALKYDK